MLTGDSASVITEAIASIEDVGSHIENTFAEVGSHLGRGHAIFQELNDGLASLSHELSGATTEGASAALQNIAAKLTVLADGLPSERALLGLIRTNAAKASSVLKALIKQIQMIMIIARSARIEAASLDTGHESFLDFTQEAIDLARAVQTSVDGCAGDQERLSDAIAIALNRQQDFETRYRAQLLSVSAELMSAHSGMQARQTESAQLAGLTGASAKRMTEAVGSAIVSLQAGDSARQRLEHICRSLRIASASDASMVPVATRDAQVAISTGPLVCQLQAAQLKGASSEFGADIGDVGRSLKALLSGATDIVGHGRSLYGGQDGDMRSFLTVVKQALAQASVLIGTCENSRKSVDDALSVLEDTLGKFRVAMASLSETIVDIILIGMNAGLKAGQLGVRGRAFVVIANELKATVDHISGGAGMLKPILDTIERSAGDLKCLRVGGDSSQMADLEPSIMSAMREIEAGNDRLDQLMSRLVQEGVLFKGMMMSARDLLADLSNKTALLPDVVRRLGATARSNVTSLSAENAQSIEPLFANMYAQYTMASERVIHAEFSQLIGFTQPLVTEQGKDVAATEDLLFF
jgi:hypothetical protein